MRMKVGGLVLMLVGLGVVARFFFAAPRHSVTTTAHVSGAQVPAGARSDPLPEEQSTREEPSRSRLEAPPEYYAEQTSECGVSLLDVSVSASGPFTRVYPVGPHQPVETLVRHTWIFGRYRVQGRFTGEHQKLSECLSFPKFEVLAFRPWGSVRRCISPGAADPGMTLDVGDLPLDRYAPQDFVTNSGPALPFIDDTACRHIGLCRTDERRPRARADPDRVIDGETALALEELPCPTAPCRNGERRVHACSGDVYCCPLLPPLDPPAPDARTP